MHEGKRGFTVEFIALAGKTIAAVTLLADQIYRARVSKLQGWFGRA